MQSSRGDGSQLEAVIANSQNGGKIQIPRGSTLPGVSGHKSQDGGSNPESVRGKCHVLWRALRPDHTTPGHSAAPMI